MMKIYAIYDFEGAAPDLSGIDGIVQEFPPQTHIVYNGIPDDGISQYRIFPENPANLIAGYEHMYSALSGQPAQYQIIAMDDKPVDIKYNIKLPLHGHSARSIVSGILSWARLPFSEEQFNQALQAAGFGDHRLADYVTRTVLDGLLSTQTQRQQWTTAFNNYPVSIALVGDSNKKIVITKNDGSTIYTSTLDGVVDPTYVDDVINTLDFNENNDGVLRAITSEGYAITASIDGRYAFIVHTHLATDIITDALRRFVSDAEKAAWNGKADEDHDHYKGLMGNNADFDAYLDPGVYVQNSWSYAGTSINSPNENKEPGVLEVFGSEGHVIQRFSSYNDGEVYVRYYYSGGFQPWRKIFDSVNLTKLSQLSNDSDFATKLYVAQAVSEVVDSSPATLNTLNELAAALGDDPDFSATVMGLIGERALKSTAISAGTGLSGGGSLGGNRTIYLSQTTQDEIAKGVDAKNGLDNLKIGGRNLLLKSINPEPHRIYFTEEFKNNFGGGIYTLSFQLEMENAVVLGQNRVGIETNIHFEDGSNQYVGAWLRNISNGDDFRGVVSNTPTPLPDKKIASGSFTIYTEDYAGGFVTGDKLEITHIKLERGNHATPWSPAPEDLVDRYTNQTIGGVKKFDEVIYAPQGFSELNGPSLRKLKENIRPFEKSGLELVNSLNTQEFDYKDKVLEDGTKIRGVKNAIGFIADDTRPEFLNEKKEAISFYNTVAILAKAVQELSEEKENLKKELKEQRESFEKRLSNLEKLMG